MTISNANILPGILTTAESSVDGQMANRMPVQSVVTEGEQIPTGDSEFWSMLSQQYGDIVSQDDVMVIENEDLLALINEFEENLEQTGDDGVISAEWMQILKSHFDDVSLNSDKQESSQHALETGEVISIEETGPVHGEALPLMWQDQATQKPVESTGNGIQVKLDTQNVPLTAVDPQVKKIIPQQNDTFHASKDLDEIDVRVKEGDFQFSDSAKDKAMPLHISRENLNAFSKSMDGMSPQQNNVSAAVQPVNSTQGQLLSSNVQSLSLQPQASATQWGDAIGERVSFLINHKLNSAEIRIDPPHLGKLDIQIQVKDDTAVIMIQTQHAQTRDLVDSASARLRDYLQDAGYSSVDVNVSHREQSAQQEGFSQQNQSAKSGHENVAGSDNDSSVIQEGELVLHKHDGVIDYFA